MNPLSKISAGAAIMQVDNNSCNKGAKNESPDTNSAALSSAETSIQLCGEYVDPALTAACIRIQTAWRLRKIKRQFFRLRNNRLSVIVNSGLPCEALRASSATEDPYHCKSSLLGTDSCDKGEVSSENQLRNQNIGALSPQTRRCYSPMSSYSTRRKSLLFNNTLKTNQTAFSKSAVEAVAEDDEETEPVKVENAEPLLVEASLQKSEFHLSPSQTEEFINKFNLKPVPAVRSFIEQYLSQSSESVYQIIVEFIFRIEHKICKNAFGDFLGDPCELCTGCLDFFAVKMIQSCQYPDDIEFSLRYFVSKFRLPGESQKIDRILTIFAKTFSAEFSGYSEPELSCLNEDTVYYISYAIIMLNTDLHNPAIKKKMTLKEFCDINSGAQIPTSELKKIYFSIRAHPIKMFLTAQAVAASFNSPSSSVAVSSPPSAASHDSPLLSSSVSATSTNLGCISEPRSYSASETESPVLSPVSPSPKIFKLTNLTALSLANLKEDIVASFDVHKCPENICLRVKNHERHKRRQLWVFQDSIALVKFRFGKPKVIREKFSLTETMVHAVTSDWLKKHTTGGIKLGTKARDDSNNKIRTPVKAEISGKSSPKNIFSSSSVAVGRQSALPQSSKASIQKVRALDKSTMAIDSKKLGYSTLDDKNSSKKISIDTALQNSTMSLASKNNEENHKLIKNTAASPASKNDGLVPLSKAELTADEAQGCSIFYLSICSPAALAETYDTQSQSASRLSCFALAPGFPVPTTSEGHESNAALSSSFSSGSKSVLKSSLPSSGHTFFNATSPPANMSRLGVTIVFDDAIEGLVFRRLINSLQSDLLQTIGNNINKDIQGENIYGSCDPKILGQFVICSNKNQLSSGDVSLFKALHQKSINSFNRDSNLEPNGSLTTSADIKDAGLDPSVSNNNKKQKKHAIMESIADSKKSSSHDTAVVSALSVQKSDVCRSLSTSTSTMSSSQPEKKDRGNLVRNSASYALDIKNNQKYYTSNNDYADIEAEGTSKMKSGKYAAIDEVKNDISSVMEGDSSNGQKLTEEKEYTYTTDGHPGLSSPVKPKAVGTGVRAFSCPSLIYDSDKDLRENETSVFSKNEGAPAAKNRSVSPASSRVGKGSPTGAGSSKLSSSPSHGKSFFKTISGTLLKVLRSAKTTGYITTGTQEQASNKSLKDSVSNGNCSKQESGLAVNQSPPLDVQDVGGIGKPTAADGFAQSPKKRKS